MQVLCVRNTEGEELTVRYEQVTDRADRFQLPINISRGLAGRTYTIRRANGMLQQVHEGDYVVEFLDHIISLDAEAFEVFLLALKAPVTEVMNDG